MVLSSLLHSCKRNVTIRETFIDESLFEVIQVDPYEIMPTEIANISEIASGVEYIPLETRHDNLIGEITALTVIDGQYYIWDKLTESILIFNADGSYSHKIHRQGRGPEEYARIYNFAIDRNNKDIYIYSDINRSIFRYSQNGEFIERIETPVLFASFEVKDDKILYYIGRSSNEVFFESSYPEQYRYMVFENGEFILNQLNYSYQEAFSSINLMNRNFVYCGDTLLLVDDLDTSVYTVADDGHLEPRYRIEFLSNEFSLSWNGPVDLDKYLDAKHAREYTSIHKGFFENSNYIFFSWANEYVGFMYVDKSDNTIHNMGIVILDDYNKVGLATVAEYVDESYIYQTDNPDYFKEVRNQATPDMQKMIDKMKDTDNPVVVKIKLK